MKQTSNIVNIALIQMSCSDKPAENLRKALSLIAEAARGGARLVCLQELFRSLYFCQAEDDSQFELAESIPGPTTEALSKAAKKNKIVLVGSVFERRTEGVYHNTAVVFDRDGKMIGKYRKMHIPDDPLFFEKFYFTPGDADPGFGAHQTSAGKIGTLVCWDQWFPEAARLTALSGARVLFYPTAIGWHPKDPAELKRAQADAWELIQRSHAVANGCFVCSVNRVGREGNLIFWGSSFIADPFGRIIAKASSGKEEILFADCNLGEIDTQRRHWPFLRDRRVDAYGEILLRLRDK